MGPGIGPILILVLSALVFGAGVVLVLTARRGRRLDDHPTCRRCRFDLIGLPEGSESCPECGAALDGPRAIRLGNRRMHRWRLATGLALLLLSLGVIGGTIAARVARYDIIRAMPAWVLLRQAPSTPDAVAELERRMGLGELSAPNARAAVDLAMARQKSPTASWSPTWGDLLDHAWNQGVLTPEERAQSLLDGIAFSLNVRKRVQQGGRLGMTLEASRARLGSMTSVSFKQSLEDGKIGDWPISDTFWGSCTLTPGGHSATWSHPKQAVGALLGRSDLDTTWRITLVPDDPSIPALEVLVPLRTPLEVVASDVPIIRMLNDQATRDLLLANLSVSQVRAVEPEVAGGARRLSVSIRAGDLPCRVSGMLVLRERVRAPAEPAREWEISSVELVPGSTAGNMSWRTPLEQDAAGIDLDATDIVIVPSLDDALINPNIEEMWGEELVLPRREEPPPGT